MASGYSDLSEIQKGNRTYGLQQKPPKINLLNEKPRRESVIEQQLTSTIVRPNFNQFQGEQQQVGTYQQQQVLPGHQYQDNSGQFSGQPYYDYNDNTNGNYIATTNLSIMQGPPTGAPQVIVKPTRYYGSPQQHQAVKTITTTVKTTTTTGASEPYYQKQQQQQRQQQQQQQQQQYQSVFDEPSGTSISTYNTTIQSKTNNGARAFDDLAAELAEKEAKLKKEIAYLNLLQSPWARPRQIREPRREPSPKVARSDQRWLKECPSGSMSRPASRASSTRSTAEADLMEKAAKLLQDVEEMERKPLNTQQILIEGGAKTSKPVDSTINQPSAVSSLHTAIIKVPNYEPNNKSPLPFSYDNFSTLGVRGNIASVGAAEPDKPYPPIFPTIKKTPSPTPRR